MTAFINSAIDVVGTYREWAYLLVFLLSFSESFPLAGALIPGSTIIFAISAMVPSGAVALVPLLASAIAGAIAGDGFSYWLGHRYREAITQKWPFSRYPGLVDHGRALFERHGRKSIVLARFTPPIRAIVPLVAGILGMPARAFYAINIASAVLWAPAHILPGALLGASLVLAHAVAGRLALFVGVVLLLMWGAVLLVRLALRRGLPLADRGQVRLRAWARGRNDWGGRQVARIFDLAAGERYALVLLGALLVAGLWLFLGVLEDVVTGDPLVRADVAVYHLLQGLRTAWGDRFMVAITEIGDAFVTTALTLAVVGWLAWWRAWRAVGYWLGAVVCATLFTNLIKVILHVPRPVELYTGWSAFSFPSGHATVNAAIYGFLALLLAREVSPRWGAFAAFAATVLVALIAFSRLYLGAHWVSDVVAGLAFGTASTALFGVIYLRSDPPKVNARGLAIVAVTTLFLAGGIHAGMQFSHDVGRYGIRHEVQTRPAADWWTAGWRDLPARRIDTVGDIEEPFILQWAGSLDDLKYRLTAAGWQTPVTWSLATTLGWLSQAPDPLALPVLPKMHDGRTASLVLVKAAGSPANRDERVVLRLWRSNVTLDTGTAPAWVWMAMMTRQRLRHLLSMVTFAQVDTNANQARQILAQSLGTGSVLRYRRTDSGAGWDGGVLLDRAPSVSLPQVKP